LFTAEAAKSIGIHLLCAPEGEAETMPEGLGHHAFLPVLGSQCNHTHGRGIQSHAMQINPNLAALYLAFAGSAFTITPGSGAMHNLMVSGLQKRLQTIETTMMKRENVIRFLIARFLLMGAMVITFWVSLRYAL
jgi:hypothetical protein